MPATAKPARRARNGGAEANRRAALLSVCARLFREKGFDGTSIRDISSAAGMHSGSPFYHFRTKQDMLVAVMEQGLAVGLARTEAVMALRLAPRARLERMIRAHLETICAEGSDFIPVLLYDWRSLEPANRRRIVALRDRYDALWQRLVDELIAAKLIDAEPHLARLLILGAVNWTAKWYRSGGPASLDEIARAATKLFVSTAR